MAAQTTGLNKWRWGYNSFVHPEKMSGYYPSFFDIPKIDPHFIQDGVIGKDDLNFINNDKILALNHGQYSIFGERKTIFPSEHINIIIDTSSVILPLPPNTSVLPECKSMGYTPSGGIYTVENFIYMPVDSGGNINRYNINYDSDGVCTLSIYGNYNSVKSNITISKFTTMGDSNVFLLPEFPVSLISIDESPSDYFIDKERGILYTTDNLSKITIDYTVNPLFSYVPSQNLSNNAHFENAQIDFDKFILLDSSPDINR